MSSDNILENALIVNCYELSKLIMDYDNTIKTIESVIRDSLLSQEQQESLFSQLKKIKTRIVDKNIYIGIVGEFASGKSTLMNSFIGEDFFITNSLQGTTTTITKLEFGRKVNLKIKLSTGKTLKYNCDETSIIKLYLPEVYNTLSGLEKMKIRVKDFFRLNRYDKYLLDAFERITTSDAISQTLSDVTVYYPSEILKNGIVIVDTPGTDSLNPTHAQITSRAIKEICDMAFVITTANNLLPQTQSDYLEENLGDVADKCIYIITKIELIRKSIERLQIRNGAIQRIENYLGVENPHVILAPSLLSLEERGVIKRTGRTDHLTDEERKELCSNYESDIIRVIEKIHKEKEVTIQEKIRRLTMYLRQNLELEIKTKEDALKKELAETHMMRVKPLREFMSDFYSTHTVYQYSYIESYIINAVSYNRSKFKNYVFDKIDSCTTKDDAQATMENPSVVSLGNNCFSSCYEEFISVLSDTQASYIKDFDDFKAAFIESFSINAIDFTYSIMNNPNWQREYDFKYDKSNLTTFKLIRWFM